MSYFSNLDYLSRGNNLTVKSTQTTRRMRPLDCATFFPVLCRLLALLLAFTVAPTMVLAQEWDHDRDQERGHANDPTGAWLLTLGPSGNLVVQNFFKDGNLVSSAQG
jgi:hypothetical protein